ncbi:Na+/glutamate symporter [Pseudomonas syringae pv. actinidiae]|uniref:Na+/glutamate symporter n=1 Tax=Pseudomonas syringae pv. actinidiae TaxID=103796 RepID=A0A2V0QLF7_PSESF|nr:Na+/glutamate symporter [Pseudomonas syringae pv. actinidiae]
MASWENRTGEATRKRPRGVATPSRVAVMASATSPSGPSVRAINISPASVSFKPRALRSISLIPICSSSSEIRRDNVALGMPLARLAFPSPSLVATSMKSISAFRFMVFRF